MKIDDIVGKRIKKWKQPERINAIYFICDPEGEIIYIGKTKNLVHRIRYHEKTIDGGSVYFLETPSKTIDKMESNFIKICSPRLNIKDNNNRIKREYNTLGNLKKGGKKDIQSLLAT